MEHILSVLIGLLVLKSTFIGSEFNFCKWWKYGKEYTRWYFNRPTFEDHLALKDVVDNSTSVS